MKSEGPLSLTKRQLSTPTSHPARRDRKGAASTTAAVMSSEEHWRFQRHCALRKQSCRRSPRNRKTTHGNTSHLDKPKISAALKKTASGEESLRRCTRRCWMPGIYKAPGGRLLPTPGNTKPCFRAGLLTCLHPLQAPSRANNLTQWRVT